MEPILTILADPLAIALTLWILGDIVVERSGVINLAIDGIITFSIAVTFVAVQNIGYVQGLLISLASTIALSLIFATFINVLHAPHVLTGLSLNIAFYGVGALIGLRYMKSRSLVPIGIGKPILALIGVATAVLTWFTLYRSRLGTEIRACGFNPRAAEAAGVRVWRTRYIATIIGYTLVSIGSYIYTTIYRSGWSQYTGMGYGFLAITLAMASSWHPLIAYPIAIAFGYLYTSSYALQLLYGVPTDVVNALPFMVSLAVVVIVYATPLSKKVAMPKALGEVYFREERAA
ncbi:MAG: ABC transporter permease [Ignisphaera sp.]